MPYLAWSEHALEGFAEIDDQQVAEFLVQNQPILYFPLLTFAPGCLGLRFALQLLFAVSFGSFLDNCFVGVFLASVFSLNHNGMPVYSTADAQKMEFYEISIRTGRNVEPTHFNNWFTGGLKLSGMGEVVGRLGSIARLAAKLQIQRAE
ncbi:hypothetical protein BASA83_002330 [Batrachochytrium salamandrivorans]|nr:hypothetical protein BASA83_002330 [Batrachochytrium salamandrivorans]